jgi:hypothetical protein
MPVVFTFYRKYTVKFWNEPKTWVVIVCEKTNTVYLASLCWSVPAWDV